MTIQRWLGGERPGSPAPVHAPPSHTTPQATELAIRESGGLRVALLWGPKDGVLTISVRDSGTQEEFELVAEDGNALDVYYHPYAYAALHGIAYQLVAAD